MKETMRVAVMLDKMKMGWENRPIPIPADDEVLVKIDYVGICGSDMHYYENGRMPKFLLRVQNLVFKFMPKSQFQNIGLTKNDFITLTNSMVNMDFTKDIEKIFCPVLVLCGEKDNVNKTVAVKLTERLPRAKFITINNSNHEINLDNPNELAKAIKEYIIEDEESVFVECEKTSGLLN